jgi:hypothetical protein
VTNSEEFGDDFHDGPRYRDVGEIGTSGLYAALIGLAGFPRIPT